MGKRVVRLVAGGRAKSGIHRSRGLQQFADTLLACYPGGGILLVMAAPCQRLDRWKRRELEISLVGELHKALEEQRVARVKYVDYLAELPSLPAADGNVRLRQLFADYERLHESYQVALEKWLQFVLDAAGLVGTER